MYQCCIIPPRYRIPITLISQKYHRTLSRIFIAWQHKITDNTKQVNIMWRVRSSLNYVPRVRAVGRKLCTVTHRPPAQIWTLFWEQIVPRVIANGVMFVIGYQLIVRQQTFRDQMRVEREGRVENMAQMGENREVEREKRDLRRLDRERQKEKREEERAECERETQQLERNRQIRERQRELREIRAERRDAHKGSSTEAQSENAEEKTFQVQQ